MPDARLAVLIVEDNPADARLISEYLKEAQPGAEITHAVRLADALEVVRRGEPDLILLDLSLPDAAGLDTVRPMRAAAGRAAVAVLTGRQDEQLATDALRQGVDDYLVKGQVEPGTLVRSLRYALERRRAINALAGAEQDVRQREERFRQLADAMPQIVWVTGADGRTDYFNQRWYEYTGLDFDQARGVGWRAAMHPEDLERVQQRWDESVSSGRPFELEYRLRRRDGEYRWFLGRALPGTDESGAIVQWFGTCTDIHDARRARAEAEKANRLKDEFLATLSHELRTPLNAVMGWAHMLRDGRLRSAATLERGLDAIKRNAEAQSRLVQDLLDMSQIEAGQLPLQIVPVNVTDVVDAALATIRPAAEAKGVEVSATLGCDGAVLHADPQRLQQILWNLLGNAVKFTPPGGRVALDVQQRGREIHLAVEDTGPGIAPEFLPHVFEAFRQADASSTREHGGLGLGLAIVRRLVSLHGGHVDVASEGAGRGASFTVRLPLP